MNSIVRGYWIARALGWRNLPRRAWREVKVRSGYVRRQLPAGELSVSDMDKRFCEGYDREQAYGLWLDRSEWLFAEDVASYRAALNDVVGDQAWRRDVGARVEAIKRGVLTLFSVHHVEVGMPPNFNYDPINRVQWPTGAHWSTYKQFDPNLGDLKCVWELSRFSWAYDLARESVRSGRPELGDLFWRLFDAWDQQNPYGSTPQWVCGQEASFRIIAIVFGASLFRRTSPELDRRWFRIAEIAYYTGRHIVKHLGYARSQQNNHALSEATGLITIGALFPELKDAARWLRIGCRVLEAESGKQILPDGSYIQHSFNYHRLMMDVLIWAIKVGRVAGIDLKRASAALVRASGFLEVYVDRESGYAPNYGPNDGARVLPLSCTPYRDCRPTLQAARALIGVDLPYGSGSWDEAMVWLAGPRRSGELHRVVRRAPPFHEASAGGYYSMSGPRSRMMIRCHSYTTRPNEADMLNLCLSVSGEEVVRDGGTYSYFARGWPHRGLSKTSAHNSVEVDGVDQMEMGPAFLWLRWVRSRLLRSEQTSDGFASYFCGEHYGYRRRPIGATHRRAVLRIADTYLVRDDILGKGVHDLRLNWRLKHSVWRRDEVGGLVWASDDGERLAIMATSGQPITAADLGDPVSCMSAWESEYYARKVRVPAIQVSARGVLPLTIVTLLSIGEPICDVVSVGRGPGEPVCLTTARAGEAGCVQLLSGGAFEVTDTDLRH